jgi:outer membrane immunogenic protein
MKKWMAVIISIVCVGSMQAQYALPKGAAQLNAGLGLSTRGIPLFIGFDYGVDTDISAGAELSYRGYNQNYFFGSYHHNIIGISGNANYHFNGIADIPEQYDVYAGLNLGFYIWTSPSDYPGGSLSGLGIGAQLGGRYYFNEKTAINLEFGGGNAFSGGKIGITVKI